MSFPIGLQWFKELLFVSYSYGSVLYHCVCGYDQLPQLTWRLAAMVTHPPLTPMVPRLVLSPVWNNMEGQENSTLQKPAVISPDLSESVPAASSPGWHSDMLRGGQMKSFTSLCGAHSSGFNLLNIRCAQGSQSTPIFAAVCSWPAELSTFWITSTFSVHAFWGILRTCLF